MTSTDLFSHPYEPESVSNTDHDSEPVKSPVFSDRPSEDPTGKGTRANERERQEALRRNNIH